MNILIILTEKLRKKVSILTIGERIKSAREAKKISQKELSSMINISPSTLSRYEQNNLKGTDNRILETIANALGVSIKYLQGYTNIISEKIHTVEVIDAYRDGEFISSSEIDVASFGLPSKELFYSIAKDDSMSPSIRKNAIVLFEKNQNSVDNSIVCLIPVNSQVPIIRKLRIVKDKILLLPLDLSKDIYIVEEGTPHKIIGRAIQVTHNL